MSIYGNCLSKSYFVGTQWNRLPETIEMRTNNTVFKKKKKLRIRKLAMQNPLLSSFAFLVQIEENTLRFTSIN